MKIEFIPSETSAYIKWEEEDEDENICSRCGGEMGNIMSATNGTNLEDRKRCRDCGALEE